MIGTQFTVLPLDGYYRRAAGHGKAGAHHATQVEECRRPSPTLFTPENIVVSSFQQGGIAVALGAVHVICLRHHHVVAIHPFSFYAVSLLTQGHSVAEAARGVGCNDPNYFNRSFKRKFGTKPSEIGPKIS
jgi:hypothetical protein